MPIGSIAATAIVIDTEIPAATGETPDVVPENPSGNPDELIGWLTEAYWIEGGQILMAPDIWLHELQ